MPQVPVAQRIARPPPKGQVTGSNPVRDATFINDRGELMAFKITRGSRHDSKEAAPLLRKFKGLAFGDKGLSWQKNIRRAHGWWP